MSSELEPSGSYWWYILLWTMIFWNHHCILQLIRDNTFFQHVSVHIVTYICKSYSAVHFLHMINVYKFNTICFSVWLIDVVLQLTKAFCYNTAFWYVQLESAYWVIRQDNYETHWKRIECHMNHALHPNVVYMIPQQQFINWGQQQRKHCLCYSLFRLATKKHRPFVRGIT